jgi:ketosteroid isomerase-like protein
VTDEDQVRAMIALWSQADAGKDVEGFAALFAEDGVYRGRRGVSRGQVALRKNLADRIAVNPAGRETMHLFYEGVISVSGDQATAVSPYIGYGRIGERPWEVMSIGRFHCELIRSGDRWYFTDVENRSIGEPGGPATVLHHPHV